MEKRNFKWLLAAVMLLLGLTAQAQSAVHPKAYYDAITFEWVDANGMTHVDPITVEATNPYQIVELLKTVYCDPRLPGPTYTSYSSNGSRERQVYYGAQDGGWDIATADVTAPYEEGYTLLMVSVNESLSLVKTNNGYKFSNRSQLVNYISSNVKSVQLLTDGMRMGEGERAGTVFNISGTYNRFFMLSKGQSRQKPSSYDGTRYGEEPPFMHMFEQLSPTSGKSGSQITDFYNEMVKGGVYSVVHDCSSVIENEHYFSMAGKNAHESRSLTGLNIFMPDYRLKYWADGNNDGRTMNPNGDYWRAYYAQYNQDYAPLVGIYTINLGAEAVPANEEHVYTVNLDWTSSLNTMAGGMVPQDYTIYIVRTDEDGNEYNEELTVVTNETHYDYTVPQDEHSYTITYVVYGQPNDGEHDMFEAWSNQASVVIPGWNDFLNLAVDHYESDFSNQHNYYRNYLTVDNVDEVSGLTRARVAGGEDSFTLYRYDVANEDVLTPVAVLTLTASATTSNVRYSVAYENQEPLPGYNAAVTTSGNVTVGQNDILNLSNIMFVDQFAASTATNEHPSRYGYVLVQNIAENAKSTNTVEVPVMKTTSAIDGYYTYDQVMNDVTPSLHAGVKNANVRMNLSTSPNVYYYTLSRGSNADPNEVFSTLQRRTNGSYEEMMTLLPQYVGQETNPGTVNRYDSREVIGIYGDWMTYQPVIWTFGDDRVKQDGENSYGSPMWKTGVADLNVSVAGTRSTTVYGEWTDEDGNKCCMFNPILTIEGIVPTDASVEYEPYMYRVWRLCDDVRGYARNATTGVPYNDLTADRSADKLIAEAISGEPIVVLGDEATASLHFGAKANTSIEFRVRFYYKVVGDNSDAPMYYVVEKVVPWTNMPTAVTELNVNNELEKTYYNAQGVKSSQPFDGVNIVVTRYSDGTTKTTKMVK